MMKCVFLEDYTSPLQIKEVPIPKPGPNQVLVKLFAAPINPSDLAILKGSYASPKPLPLSPGNEGSGLVIESGGGLMGWKLKGKRVALTGFESTNGTWAEYIVVDTANCIEIDNKISYEEGCNCFVNPLTVVAMLDLCKENKYKTIVNSAAASALGRMINRTFKINGIKVINIVRKKEHEEILEKEGAEFILNQNDQDFEAKLKDLAQKLNALCFFDAVSGDLTAKVLKNMPNGSTAYIYGSLENDKFILNPADLMFKLKKIKGFWVSLWVRSKGLIGKAMLIYNLKSMLGTALKTHVNKVFPLEKINEALEFYQKNMSFGKVIISPVSNVEEIEKKGEIIEENKQN